MNAADRRRLTPLLGVAAAALALLLVALWAGVGRGARWHDHAVPPPLPPPDAALPTPTIPPFDQFADVWQHPLFSPTRSPEAAAGGDDEASGDLRLTGVIMLPGLRMALLHDNARNKDYRIVEGQPAHDGPVLIELQPRSAVVESSGSRLQLQLVSGPSPEAGNTPPQGAAPEPAGGGGAGSGMVSHRAGPEPGAVQTSTAAAESATAAARAAMLKARIEANRRRTEQKEGR